MKYLLLLSLFLFAQLIVDADVINTAEESRIYGVGNIIRNYQKYIENVPVTSWDQIAEVTPNLYGVNGTFGDQDMSELYSFIPLEERSKFPRGELILIRYEPLPFPNAYKNRIPKDDPRFEADKTNPRYQPIRYLLYQDAEGNYQSYFWYESKVQEMLKTTGIKVPKPIKFTNYIDPSTHIDIALRSSQKAQVKTEAPAVEPDVKVLPIETSVEITEETPEKSPNLLPWILGALALLLSLGFVFRRKS